jgi:hypothetical protein
MTISFARLSVDALNALETSLAYTFSRLRQAPNHEHFDIAFGLLDDERTRSEPAP